MNEIYNESYYNNYGNYGTGYLEDERIEQTLDGLADFLCENLQIETHMDVGCAMGYLVRSMVRRGKESRGIDISEYAIDNAVLEAKDLLRVHDIRKPIGLYKYDLVTCVEVVEHIEPQYTDRVLQNICNASSRYIFFSSRFDFNEPTHINVRLPGYWFGLLEQRGFKLVPIVYSAIDWGLLVERR